MISRRKLIYFIVTAFAIYFTFIRDTSMKASEALEIVLDFADHLYSIESKMEAFLSETKYDSLVIKDVKAATNEIASIRKQTEIYENMQRIPGGPQNFMETSITRLDKIRTDLLSWEKQYRLTTARLQKTWTALAREIDNCDSQLEYIFEVQDSLDALKIYFINPEKQDLDVDTQNSHHLNKIVNLVRIRLLPTLQEFENIKIKNSQSPIFESNDIYKKELFRTLETIQMILQMHGEHFEKVGGLIVNKLRDVKKMTYRLLDMDKAKVRYEDLAYGIDTDITSLKEKIKNLKYPKEKKDEF